MLSLTLSDADSRNHEDDGDRCRRRSVLYGVAITGTLHVKKETSVFEMMVGGFSAQPIEQVKTMEKTLVL
jgi:hypothetical protein